MRVFLVAALATSLLVPAAVAQKPSPTPPRPTPPPGGSTIPAPASSDSTQPEEDRVMFLAGHVATDDGTPVPNDVLIKRVCYNKVRQQVHANSQGDFNMELGSRTDSYLDATSEPASRSDADGKDSTMGIPRRELTNCDLQASTAGFRSDVVSLVALDAFAGRMDVGVIVVQRTTKIEGMTLSATPYKAPQNARKAYEKGLDAENKANLAGARKYFETAVKIYPKYVSAWFQLGIVLENQNQNDAARSAYTQATTIDTRFLPPYLSLAMMACHEENWAEVVKLTGHILDLDPLNQAAVTGYILDLDPLNSTEAYFYNALANFKLSKFEDAEKSALKAEHVDLRPHFPQLHLLLAELFARRNNYAGAISELRYYLELAPHSKNEEQVRERLAKWEKLNGSVSTGEKPEHM